MYRHDTPGDEANFIIASLDLVLRHRHLHPVENSRLGRCVPIIAVSKPESWPDHPRTVLCIAQDTNEYYRIVARLEGNQNAAILIR